MMMLLFPVTLTRGKKIPRRVPMVWLIATVAFFSRSNARAVTTQVVGNIKTTAIIRYRVGAV